MSNYIHGLSITSISDIEKVVKLYRSSHNSPIVTVDTTHGEQSITLTSDDWIQGVFSQVVIQHSGGNNPIRIDILNVDALELQNEGDSTLFHCVRVGQGTGAIRFNQQDILVENTTVGICLLQIQEGEFTVKIIHNI